VLLVLSETDLVRTLDLQAEVSHQNFASEFHSSLILQVIEIVSNNFPPVFSNRNMCLLFSILFIECGSVAF